MPRLPAATGVNLNRPRRPQTTIFLFARPTASAPALAENPAQWHPMPQKIQGSIRQGKRSKRTIGPRSAATPAQSLQPHNSHAVDEDLLRKTGCGWTPRKRTDRLAAVPAGRFDQRSTINDQRSTVNDQIGSRRDSEVSQSVGLKPIALSQSPGLETPGRTGRSPCEPAPTRCRLRRSSAPAESTPRPAASRLPSFPAS